MSSPQNACWKATADWLEEVEQSARNAENSVDIPSYKLMTGAGFSKKPALEGVGAGAGEDYAWAVENADKVSCIHGENPVLRGAMVTKGKPDENAKVPHIDNLSPLARAGVSILHVCGSLDPWLDRETRVAEKNYKALGGHFTVIIMQGEGHFAVGPQDPKPSGGFHRGQNAVTCSIPNGWRPPAEGWRSSAYFVRSADGG